MTNQNVDYFENKIRIYTACALAKGFIEKNYLNMLKNKTKKYSSINSRWSVSIKFWTKIVGLIVNKTCRPNCKWAASSTKIWMKCLIQIVNEQYQPKLKSKVWSKLWTNGINRNGNELEWKIKVVPGCILVLINYHSYLINNIKLY